MKGEFTLSGFIIPPLAPTLADHPRSALYTISQLIDCKDARDEFIAPTVRLLHIALVGGGTISKQIISLCLVSWFSSSSISLRHAEKKGRLNIAVGAGVRLRLRTTITNYDLKMSFSS